MTDRPSGTRRMVAPELLPGLERLPQVDFSSEFLAVVRSAMASGESAFGIERPPLTPTQQAVRCEERFVPGPRGAPDVRVLVYTPAGEAARPRPALLHIHGGGYIIGNPEQNDGSNRSVAAQVGCLVVSVDYRLAPETRFPGALEDCYAALTWLHAEAEALGIDPTRIAVTGESAGGGHAAALALCARDRGEIPLCFQLLDCPMLDDRTGSTSDPHPYCGEFVWTPASNRFGWASLLGVEPGGPAAPQGAAPARVDDLSGLPPTFLLVGALDLFLEEDLEYARRLIRAGVSTELHVVPGAYHGFGVAGGETPQVRGALQLAQAALARAFGGA